MATDIITMKILEYSWGLDGYWHMKNTVYKSVVDASMSQEVATMLKNLLRRDIYELWTNNVKWCSQIHKHVLQTESSERMKGRKIINAERWASPPDFS